MTFEELRLCMAIHKTKSLGGGDRTSMADRIQAACLVMQTYAVLFEDSYFPYRIDDIERWRMAMRKNKRVTRVKIDVALAHGPVCFWMHRNKGPCCNYAEVGHLIPRCQDGPLSVANAVIECRSHNNQRRERTIEQYIAATDLVTGGPVNLRLPICQRSATNESIPV